MPLMGEMLDRKLLKDIDNFNTPESTHTKHTVRMTHRGCYKFKYSDNIDSQYDERDNSRGFESSEIYTSEGG